MKEIKKKVRRNSRRDSKLLKEGVAVRRNSRLSSVSKDSGNGEIKQKKKKRRGSVRSGGKSKSKSKGSNKSSNSKGSVNSFQERLSEYRASHNSDSDDENRRMKQAPKIDFCDKDPDNLNIKEESKRGRKRRNSRTGSKDNKDNGDNLSARRKSIGLRRDSRSGAREVSPAAFLSYQNNCNLSDMSQFA